MRHAVNGVRYYIRAQSFDTTKALLIITQLMIEVEVDQKAAVY
jgi:hypothetical protein